MRPKVLIVDDDRDLRRALAAILGRVCEILEAAGGARALELVEKDPPQLVLLDVSMPGLDGFEVLARLRRACPAAKVVMLTSHKEIELAQRALKAGAAAYMTKPFDPAHIRAEVARLIEPARPRADGKPWRTAG